MSNQTRELERYERRVTQAAVFMLGQALSVNSDWLTDMPRFLAVTGKDDRPSFEGLRRLVLALSSAGSDYTVRELAIMADALHVMEVALQYGPRWVNDLPHFKTLRVPAHDELQGIRQLVQSLLQQSEVLHVAHH